MKIFTFLTFTGIRVFLKGAKSLSMDHVLLLQQQPWQQLIIQEIWTKTKEKNPTEEAIVLFSKSINNLHDELHEDYFLSVFRENLPGW